MNYLLYHNLSREGRLDGFSHGNDLWIDPTVYTIASPNDLWSATGTVIARCDVGDLNAIFARHNRDDRPDGRIAPSLSVGDIIVINDYIHGGRYPTHPLYPDRMMNSKFFAVEPFGFTEIDPPGNVSTDPDWRSARDAAESRV